MRVPEPEDNWYETSRAWTYSRRSWNPRWYNKAGWPYLGSDEWGRRTIVWGLGFIGYVVWAYRTCWCQECHGLREQEYWLSVQRFVRHQSKLDRGQCICFNAMVYERYCWPQRLAEEPVPTVAPPSSDEKCEGCQHLLQEHDKFGDCTHVDESMRGSKTTPPEILEQTT